MSENLRVCMLVQRSLEHDSRVQREARTLVDAGYDVTILEVGATGQVPGLVRRSVRAAFGTARGGIRLRVHQLTFMCGLFASVVRRQPAIVHAHDVATLLPAALATRLTGAPLIYDAHELASGVAYRHGLTARLITRMERIATRRAAGILTVSDSIADRMQATHGLPGRPVVVRNFCALPRPGEPAPGPSLRVQVGIDGQPLVLHQGAAAPGRGCENLVAAMASVPQAHLVFLGTPEAGFTSRLAGIARELELEDRVHFVPAVPPDRLLATTSEADVGVTLFEASCENYRLTLPNKLFEYVAAGVPVVGSSMPEVERVIVEHEIGWTVDPSSPDMIARVLRIALEAASDPEVRTRLIKADASFSWPEEGDKLVQLYRAVAP
jgi:glycosyltransferase involved in cell wall biosynthesis